MRDNGLHLVPVTFADACGFVAMTTPTSCSPSATPTLNLCPTGGRWWRCHSENGMAA